MVGLDALLRWVGRSCRRIAASLVGVALLLAGLVMMITPGPGMLAVIAGLSVLATEYAWARRALASAKRRAVAARDRARVKAEARGAPRAGARLRPANPGDLPAGTHPVAERPADGPRYRRTG
ncbi:MAG: PGPGW domain-containing protein [Acidimicrobiia bacterium]